MTAMLDAADGSGVSCCHENEKEIYGDITERVLDLHETLGSRLKGIFDPANFIQCGVDTLEAFNILLPYIEYMHIKDVKKVEGTVVPSGFGDGQITKLIKIYSSKPGRSFLSVEPHLAVFKGFENLEDNKSINKDFVYESTEKSFTAAVEAAKSILNNLGINEIEDKGGYKLWKK